MLEKLTHQTWQVEMRQAIKSSHDLFNFLETPIDQQPFQVFIPKSFAQKIKAAGKDSVLWKQFIPDQKENNIQGFYDPIGDSVHAKDNGIIHRYENRILFSPSTICPINCRYCFRKNELNNETEFLKANTSRLIEYLKDHPEVTEVILTGGDPLILTNQKLDFIFSQLSQIDSIKYIRFHSRTPVILPQRIDQGFIDLILKFQNHFETIALAIHTNHIDEIDENCAFALKKLQTTDLLLLSQTVMLKDINDNLEDLCNLYQGLNKYSVRPYYLHHPDQVMGAMHFYLPLREGRKLYAQLRNKLPGWLIPHYIIDSPMGHGKSLAYNPESFEFSGQLIDRLGEVQNHQEPV